MSNNANNKKSRSRVNWIVGIIVSLFAAGGGIVALLEYNDSINDKEYKIYLEKMEAWNNFSPKSISRGVQDAELLGGRFIDIDKGHVAMSMIGSSWDLQFNIDQYPFEGIRTNKGVKWSSLGVIDFESISYREIRDATYSKPRHLDSREQRRNDTYLYLSHLTSAPKPGYAFTLKTSAKNIALVQVLKYRNHTSGSRNIVLRYKVFPVVKDPPRPRR